jgi:3',5'-cyclic AMP phosphodiesterase CpdA
MIRRDFFRNTAALGATLFLPSFAAGTRDEDLDIVHSSTELQTTILMNGLQEPFTLLHITDSHVSCENDETEEPYLSLSKWMRDINGPGTHRHFETGEMLSPLECFERILALAKEKQPDLLVLTGDIINYPSEMLVRVVMDLLKQTGIPWIYTAGNHDWYYDKIPGEADALRKEWIEKRLLPFYQGENPMYGSKLWKGVNLVTIDNSTEQVNEEQLAFYRRQTALPYPIVLFVHIPLYMPVRRYEAKENPMTAEFRRTVFNTKQLLGVFTGHYHEHRVITRNGKVQYITSQAADGRYRFLHFKPNVF